MKTIKKQLQKRTLIFTLLVTCLFYASCSSNDDMDEERFNGKMEAKINGRLIIFESAYGYGFFNLEQSCYENFHQIIGSFDLENIEGHTIYLSIHPSNGVGTFDIFGNYIRWEGAYNDGLNNEGFGYNSTCEAQNGSLTITSVENNRYKGTFHLTVFNNECDDEIVITDGKFEINQESIQDRPCGF